MSLAPLNQIARDNHLPTDTVVAVIYHSDRITIFGPNSLRKKIEKKFPGLTINIRRIGSFRTAPQPNVKTETEDARRRGMKKGYIVYVSGKPD